MRQLTVLARPFAPNLISAPPKGKFGSYAAHSIYTQKLLAVLGPYDFEVRQVIRNTTSGNVEAVVCRLTVEIDGRKVSVEEAGDCEHPEGKHTEGDRMKDALSDAFKRCCMRIGLGLHLWAQEEYFLYNYLSQEDSKHDDDQAGGADEGSAPGA